MPLARAEPRVARRGVVVDGQVEVADAVGPVWGYGSGAPKDPGPYLGELRNMWKPTAVQGLWFMGGNLAQARHYSRLVALQLAARYDGLATHLYRKPVHNAHDPVAEPIIS